MPARILALSVETHGSGRQLRGLQGCHALRLGPRARRVVSETSAFDGNSVWTPFHHGSQGVRTERCAAGHQKPTARGRAPVANGDGSATFRLGLRSAHGLPCLASGAFSRADARTARGIQVKQWNAWTDP